MRARVEAQRYRLHRRGAATRWAFRLALAALAALAACEAPDERTPPANGPPGGLPVAEAEPARERPVVLFLGDSLTAGYGLSADEAYPALIQQRIDAAKLDYRVVNAGVSGDTSAGGRRRIAWLLRQPVAVLVLALGANDMLRGQSLVALRDNLRAIVAETRAAYPTARTVIAGMRAPSNLGRRYVDGFEATFPALARETGSALIPFLLEGVAADAQLNQSDGIHPTAVGHRAIAETVWQVLGPLLRARPAARG
jgi:acyl-CoA thioesterase-1